MNDVLMIKQVAYELGITNQALSRYIRIGVIAPHLFQRGEGKWKIIRASDLDVLKKAIREYRGRSRKYRRAIWLKRRQQTSD